MKGVVLAGGLGTRLLPLTRITQRFESHWSSFTQAEPLAPSVQRPPLSPSAQVPSTQCSGLLQRSPIPPALHVQPAPASSWAQRPSAQSASS